MAKRSRWLLGCGIGCGVVIVAGIVLATLSAVWVRGFNARFDEAESIRKQLDEQFGSQDTYTPPVDAPSPERLEVFLSVRDGLSGFCPRFQATIGRLEGLDEQGPGEEPTRAEVWDIMKSAWGLAPLLSEFIQARNQTLQGAGMGLGEYTYIHILAYRSGDSELRGSIDPRGDRRLRGRLRERFLGMMDRQRAELDAGQGGEELEAEITALRESGGRMPWEDGLPAALEEGLAPYRERLLAEYCPAGQDFELTQMHRRGLIFQNE